MKSIIFLFAITAAWGFFTSVCKQTGDKPQPEIQTKTTGQTPQNSQSQPDGQTPTNERTTTDTRSANNPSSSPTRPVSTDPTVSFPSQVGIWRLRKSAGYDEIIQNAIGDERKLVAGAQKVNAAIYEAPDGRRALWADIQFDSPDRAMVITREVVSGFRQAKGLRTIYDTPNNGSMFADSQDNAVAFSTASTSVQMFSGRGSENLRSFITAASGQ